VLKREKDAHNTQASAKLRLSPLGLISSGITESAAPRQADCEQGERDYINISGSTGPLVYPAGFLYLFSGLRAVTGGDVPSAQAAFAALYLATQAVVLALYVCAKVGSVGQTYDLGFRNLQT